MAADNETSRYLKFTKIVQAIFIFSVLVYAAMLYIFFPLIGGIGVFYDEPVLITIAQVFGILSIASIVAGYFLLRLAAKRAQQEMQMLFATYMIRAALFLVVGIFGLMLGILGAGWQISLPFIAVSGLLLILTFPTEEKWKKIIGEKENGNG